MISIIFNKIQVKKDDDLKTLSRILIITEGSN